MIEWCLLWYAGSVWFKCKSWKKTVMGYKLWKNCGEKAINSLVQWL
jgi:hypothetical protein